MPRGKIGKREYLNDTETKDFMIALNKRIHLLGYRELGMEREKNLRL